MAQFTLGNTQKSSRLGRNYTLDDLDDNEEFQEVSERFLTSVGEKSDDVFEYLRDSDYNLFSGMQRAVESGKFNDQQKQDYKYLRNRFDKADMGSFKQYLSLTKDVSIDIVTDPTAILATILTPVTGGTSLAIKAGISKGVIEGSKAIAKGKLKDVGKKQIGKAAAITGAEVGAWTGLDNHFKQNTEVNTGIRKLYSNTELAGSAAMGVLTGGILGGFVQRNELFNSRVSRLYSNDTYRKESELKYKIKKSGAKFLAKTIGNASTIMKPFAKYSDAAADLGQRFSEEFSKKLGERSTKRIGWNYSEDLGNRRGNYLLEFDNLLTPIRKTGHVLPDDEIQILRILRGASPSGARQEVQKVAKDLRKFFNKIDADAKAAGMETNTVENYFTRHWNREAIEKNRPTFENQLVKDGIVKRKDVSEIVDGMLNKQNELYSSHSNLISQARIFKNMDDNKYESFLTNDLVPVTTNYFMNAAKIIEHKLHFLGAGKNVKVLKKYVVTEDTKDKERTILFKQKNEDLFAAKWIKKIEQELKDNGGQTLTGKDKVDILNTYKSITGQVNYFDSGLMQGTYDTIKLANAMAYLPLATVSSLSEAFITLGKAPTSSAIKGYQDAVTKGHKIFTDEIGQLLKEKHKMTDDSIRREMNSVFIAVDEVMGDVTNRISGEGLQSPFLQKAARGFYRFNLLIPWTKTVQLAAFSTGKDLISGNLRKLSEAQKKSKLNIKDFSSDVFAQDTQVQKLKGELFDLGIDVETGIQWINRGEKNNVKFYKEIVRGAGRFTNGVILPTARESGRVPTFMTNPKIDIFTQFLRYPTVFSNTILKNFARDTITNPTASAPKIAAFVAMATNVAKATNYWRSNEEKRDEIDRKGSDWQDTLKAYQRVGLLGPLEYGLRMAEGLTYGQNPLVAGLGVGGPIINDVVGMTLYNRGLVETIARKVPLTGTKTVFGRNLGDFMEEYTGFREPYTPLQEAGKQADKLIGGSIRDTAEFFTGSKKPTGLMENRLLKFEGGLVPKVDPYTGIPYEIKEHKIELYSGGLASKMYERKAYKEGLSVESDVTDVEDNPADRSIDGTGQSFRKVAGQDTEAKTPVAVTNFPLVEQQQETDVVLPTEEKVSTDYTASREQNILANNKRAAEVNIKNLLTDFGTQTLNEYGFDSLDKKIDSGKVDKDGKMITEIRERDKIRFANIVYNAALDLGLSSNEALFASTQASVETGYGASVGANLYGIKATKAEIAEGKALGVNTWEQENKKEIDNITDFFVDLRKNSVKDNIIFWKNKLDKLYPEVLPEIKNGNFEEGIKWLKRVEEGGNRTDKEYATDNNYVQTLKNTLEGVKKRTGF